MCAFAVELFWYKILKFISILVDFFILVDFELISGDQISSFAGFQFEDIVNLILINQMGNVLSITTFKRKVYSIETFSKT